MHAFMEHRIHAAWYTYDTLPPSAAKMNELRKTCSNTKQHITQNAPEIFFLFSRKALTLSLSTTPARSYVRNPGTCSAWRSHGRGHHSLLLSLCTFLQVLIFQFLKSFPPRLLLGYLVYEERIESICCNLCLYFQYIRDPVLCIDPGKLINQSTINKPGQRRKGWEHSSSRTEMSRGGAYEVRVRFNKPPEFVMMEKIWKKTRNFKKNACREISKTKSDTKNKSTLDRC